MTRSELKEQIKKLPRDPGVYNFKDDKNKSLYIGKASNLKNRLKSYVETNDIRFKTMMSFARKLDFIETKSDIEALILESQLIKDFMPQFNIMLRDDKQYFHVGFTKDVFPKLFLTHQPQGFDAKFIGPFTDGSILKSTLRFLRKIFPYCTCKNAHNNLCLNYHIGKCPGFCCLKDSPERSRRIAEEKEYLKNIATLKEVLNGKRKSLIKALTKKMISAAQKENFEMAIKIRKKVDDLKRIFENAMIIRNIQPRNNTLKELSRILKIPKPLFRIEGYDISNIQGTNAAGSMVVFENGISNKSQYRKFKIKIGKTPNDILMLGEIFERRFNHPEWRRPDLILVDGGKGQLNATQKAIELSGENIPVMSLAKGKYEIFSTTLKKPIPMTSMPPSVQNLIKNIDAEAHRFAISYYRRLHRQRVLII
ncbi:MAG: hypothetical protein COV30_02205 [Candidatus Yanofskybacteria bacterium CG10_big_fil_rev_8_21_14_0_10_37_15]|uniref:Excinuclease ABC subunit C n=1 Tax=Candidatus Yanofskybacteria bacterium CG10_big_fil_rev_8_21_14_0_10_37_15 TaxID=1975097 RepID=A0A2H0R5C8_9BACT|nr:MAG: hypothetical protein COV30_02205 [Candidatus Yanofskybacteria bacterium CG10_big_fil_rev_8_21_14_0_10_37_15]